MPTMTLSQSRRHRRSPEESMIQESLQLVTVELSTNLTTHHRSTLIQLHRSTMHTENRPTHAKKNRSTLIQMSGRKTTTTPLLPLTPDKICIQTSMMKTMRRNELLSTKPSLMRKINSYIIPLGDGMHH
ncbi:hypothetical protein YC2023_098266 [Brassica napus]|uniref:Uncharacterized protein n=1 Tax=Brassica oleracea TaxID=3712 RepID=A0A3P6GJH3_BRAOL|nr:unnamed protein product [Brassica oleracea]